MLTIGFNRAYNTGSRSNIVIKGKMVIKGRGTHAFGAGCCVGIWKNGILEIGDNFGCTGDSYISVSKHITIGKNNLWSYNNVVMDYDGHSICLTSGEKINHPKEIRFGDNVWMGCGCTILKGSAIPANTIIASRSMITKPLDGSNCIITTQGKVIRENIIWKP